MTNAYGEEAMGRVFPNIRALAGVLDIMGSNVEENRWIFERMADTTGSLDKAFSEISEGGLFRAMQLWAQQSVTLTRLSDDVIPAVIPGLERLTAGLAGLTAAFAALDPETRQWLVMAVAAIAGAGPVLIMVGMAMSAIGTMAAFALSPIGALIALLAGAALLLVDDWSEVPKFFSDLWNDVLQTFENADRWVRRNFGIGLLDDAAQSADRMRQAARWLGGALLALPVLRWARFIPILRWGTFITRLAWSAFIAPIAWLAAAGGRLAWPLLVPALRWARFIPVIGWVALAGTLAWAVLISDIDWSEFIADLEWTDYIEPLTWAALITPLVWRPFIVPIAWAALAGGRLAWSTLITLLSWARFIPIIGWVTLAGTLAWSGLIEEVDWDRFLSAISWDGWIPSVDWGELIEAIEWRQWVTDLDWGALLPVLSWTAVIPGPLDTLRRLFTFEWRAILPEWNWSAIIPSVGATLQAMFSFRWADLLPNWNWRDIIPPLPGFLGGGGNQAEERAGGGPVQAGRPYIVGERGWELFVPQQSGRIVPHNEARRIGVGGTHGFAAVGAGTARAEVGGRIVVEAAPGARVRNVQSDNPAVPIVVDRGNTVDRA